MVLGVFAQELVDLGLPIGTKWKDKNESDLFNYNMALVEFGGNHWTLSSLGMEHA